ncbi:MAG: hypothetical protein QGH60_05260 [Phycisphaerae bacterium]|jgi:hypothetical protein|nr:hypothetical protein [Phycisphaerae bacterium]
MKIITHFLIAVFLLPIFSVAGCGRTMNQSTPNKIDQSTAEKTAEAFFRAWKDKDESIMASLIYPPEEREKAAKLFAGRTAPEKFDRVERKRKSDDSAEILYGRGGDIDMQKIDGKWYIVRGYIKHIKQ